jgi:hypothetical protein
MRICLIAVRSLAGGTILLSALVGCGNVTLDSRSVPCVLTSFGASLTCVSATDVAQAEAQLPFASVDPSPIVRSATGLRLSSVILAHPGLVVAGRTLPQARSITYVFGTFPRQWGGMMSIPVPARPRFLLVDESSPTASARRWRMGRVLGHLANGKPEYWPWNFWSTSANVKGSVPKRAIRAIGLWVLAHQSRKS